MYQRTSGRLRAGGGRSASAVGGRADRRQVQHDAQPAAATVGPQRLQRQAVAEQQVVRHLHRGAHGWQMPGANTPHSWPSTATTQGSLWVVMAATRSPSSAAMASA
jgi:uncharacterized protein YhdP